MDPNSQFNRAERLLLWLVGNLFAVAAVAWIAFQIQQEAIAPAVLFPLLVGGVLGAAGGALWQWCQVPALRGALVGAAVWGLLVVFVQDYIGHRHRAWLYEDEMARQTPLMAMAAGPQMRPTFGESLAGVVRSQPVWWTADLLLTSAATVAATALVARRIKIQRTGSS